MIPFGVEVNRFAGKKIKDIPIQYDGIAAKDVLILGKKINSLFYYNMSTTRVVDIL